MIRLDNTKENKRKIVIVYIALAVVWVMFIIVTSAAFHSKDREVRANMAPDVTGSETSDTQEIALENNESHSVNIISSAVESKSIEKSDLSRLEEHLRQKLKSYNGEWSVYVKDLDSNRSFSINNKQMYAASLIKLFAMAGAYEKINEGIIKEKGISNTIDAMIRYSDNDAFNSIVWQLGKTYINEWCKNNGYKDTVECHGLYPSNNGDGLRTAGGDNLTTVKDVGRLLESIYNGKCVSRECSQKMIGYLLKQELRDKIPVGLSDGVKAANKTGETEDYNHDAAIVYSKSADYVIVVMGKISGHAWDTNGDIQEISKIVYKFFNS